MTEPSAPPKPAPDAEAECPARRLTRIVRRERAFILMASSYTLSQIAKKVRTGVATFRRGINQARAEQPLEAPKGVAQAQVARLIKALRLAEAAVEFGELKGATAYLRIAAALDRFHELAAGSPPPSRSTKPPRAPPAPPRAPTATNPSAIDEPTGLEVARAAAEEPER